MKRGIAILLTLALMASLLPGVTLAWVDCGICGENLQWCFDSESNTLTISGTGEMYDYKAIGDLAPWRRYIHMKSIVISEGVTSIGSYAFNECNAHSIVIPDSVTSIGDYAFNECSNLTNVEIPDSITSIGSYAFRYCENLTSIVIPKGVHSIEAGTFYSCRSLTSIIIPEGVTIIGALAFEGCSALSNITIPDSVTNIGDEAFMSCSNLTSIRLPCGVTRIGDNTFNYCIRLKKVSFPSSLISIGERAFSNCPLTDIKVPYGVTTIGKGAFINSPLTEIVLPDSLISVGSNVFNGMNPLGSIYFGGDKDQWSSLHIFVDARVTIHYNCTGPEDVPVPNNQYRFHIIDHEGRNLPNVRVTYGSQTGMTNSAGLVTFGRITFGTPSVTAELEGYLPWSNADTDWKKQSDGSETIVLYPVGLGEYKLRTCVYSNNSDMSRSTDLLTETKTVGLGNDALLTGDFDFGKFYICCAACEIQNVVRYELRQGERKLSECTDGRFPVLSTDDFSSGGECFIRVVSTDGKRVDTRINLQFKKQPINKSSSISISDKKIAFKVGDDVPFLGGQDITFDMPLKVPMEMYFDDSGKIRITYNFASTEDEKTQSERYDKMKQLITDARKAGNLKLGGLSDSQQTLFESLIKDKNELSFITKGEVNVIGYAEADIGSKIGKGQLMLQAKFKAANLEYNTWIVVVPVTVQVELGLSGSMLGDFGYDWENATFLGDIDAQFSGELKAFGGAGVSKAVGVGAYGSAKLDVKSRVIGKPQGLQNVDLTGELGLKAYLAWWEYERAFAYNTWHLYTANTVRTYSDGEPWQLSLYDVESYQERDLSYLSEESDWMGYPMMTFTTTASTTLTALLSDTYRNAQPVLAAGQDGLYAAFLRADATTGDVYTAVTKYDGVWRDPVRVDDAAVLDGAPKLCVDDAGTVWLAYTRTTPDAETSALLDYAREQTVVVGCINPDTLAFTETAAYPGTGYAHMIQLSVVDGTPALAWLDSTVTDDNSVIYPTNSTVYTSSCVDGAWQEPQVLTTVAHYVSQLIIGTENDSLAVAYVADTDNDPGTSADQTLYCWTNNTTSELAQGVLGRVTFAKLPDMSTADYIWNGEGTIQAAEGTVIPAEGISNEYAVVDDRIYYSAAGEDGTYLTSVLYDSEWGAPVTITGGERYLENMSAVRWNNTDYVMGMDTLATITENNVDDAKNLVWAAVMPTHNLRLESVDYEAKDLVAGAEIPVELTVLNAGDQLVTSVDISVAGETTTETCSIAPGKSEKFTVTVTCPAELTEYLFTVCESGETDYTPDDNTAAVGIGYGDLSVKLTEQRIGSLWSLTALVKNEGVAPSSGNIQIVDEDGNVVEVRTFGALNAGDSVLLSTPIDRAGDFSVTISCDDADLYTYNNSDTVHVERFTEIQSITQTGNEVQTTIYASEVATVYCVVYTEAGQQTKIQTLNIAPGVQNLSFALEDTTAADVVKIIVLDERQQPLCTAKYM